MFHSRVMACRALAEEKVKGLESILGVAQGQPTQAGCSKHTFRLVWAHSGRQDAGQAVCQREEGEEKRGVKNHPLNMGASQPVQSDQRELLPLRAGKRTCSCHRKPLPVKPNPRWGVELNRTGLAQHQPGGYLSGMKRIPLMMFSCSRTLAMLGAVN